MHSTPLPHAHHMPVKHPALHGHLTLQQKSAMCQKQVLLERLPKWHTIPEPYRSTCMSAAATKLCSVCTCQAVKKVCTAIKIPCVSSWRRPDVPPQQYSRLCTTLLHLPALLYAQPLLLRCRHSVTLQCNTGMCVCNLQVVRCLQCSIQV